MIYFLAESDECGGGVVELVNSPKPDENAIVQKNLEL